MRFVILALALGIQFFGTGRAAAFRWGVEVGGSYSALDRRDVSLPNQEIDARLMPAVALVAEHRVTSRWSLLPTVRYAQDGETSSWHYQNLIGGREESREHTLGAGVGLRCRMAGPTFLMLSPELTYLLAGNLSQAVWGSSRVAETAYASASDRWNGTVRAGIGAGWSLAGGTGSVSLRYVRGINDMTRIVPAALAANQRNIAWYSAPIPLAVSEWRMEGLELVAGFQW